jgi:hypothetical protein
MKLRLSMVLGVVVLCAAALRAADEQQNQKDDQQQNQKDDKQQNQKDDGQQNQKEGDKNEGELAQVVVKAIDPGRNILTVTVTHRGKQQDVALPLAKNVAVVVAGKQARVVDLKPGMLVALNLTEDGMAIQGVTQVVVK